MIRIYELLLLGNLMIISWVIHYWIEWNWVIIVELLVTVSIIGTVLLCNMSTKHRDSLIWHVTMKAHAVRKGSVLEETMRLLCCRYLHRVCDVISPKWNFCANVVKNKTIRMHLNCIFFQEREDLNWIINHRFINSKEYDFVLDCLVCIVVGRLCGNWKCINSKLMLLSFCWSWT